MNKENAEDIKIWLGYREFSQAEIEKMYEILKELSQTCEYEYPYRIPPLVSRAHSVVSKSEK